MASSWKVEEKIIDSSLLIIPGQSVRIDLFNVLINIILLLCISLIINNTIAWCSLM